MRTRVGLMVVAAAGLATACTTDLYAAIEDTAIAPLCDYGSPHPQAPAELEQFSFLIGDFEITSHIMTRNGWSPPRPGPRARWNGWYSMGGMMITDEWYDPDPADQPDAPRGVNVRMFDEDSNEWIMMWVATPAARVQDLRAAMKDGKLTMWQVYPTKIDLVADFTVEDDDHWHRISYVRDETDEWVPKFKLRATRIPCE